MRIIRRDDLKTESDFASQLALVHGDRRRFDHRRDAWFELGINGISHRCEQGKLKAEARALADEDGAILLRRNHSVQGAISLAASEFTLALRGCVWDLNPWLCGTPNGVIDLEAGQLCERDPLLHSKNMVTKSFGCGPADKPSGRSQHCL